MCNWAEEQTRCSFFVKYNEVGFTEEFFLFKKKLISLKMTDASQMRMPKPDERRRTFLSLLSLYLL